LGIGDWGLGIGDWGLGPIPNPQSPIPNPQFNFVLKRLLLFVSLNVLLKIIYILKIKTLSSYCNIYCLFIHFMFNYYTIIKPFHVVSIHIL